MSDEHLVSKTNTPVNIKDLWRTPKGVFNALDNEFCFDVDICASEDNKLCDDYFSENFSALDSDWDYFYRGASCFLNPPYSMTQAFLNRASMQAKKHNLTIVALVNANTDTKWFSDAASSANEIRLITGRLAFTRDDGEKVNGNTKGQCLIIWRGKSSTPCQITMISRESLTE